MIPYYHTQCGTSISQTSVRHVPHHPIIRCLPTRAAFLLTLLHVCCALALCRYPTVAHVAAQPILHSRCAFEHSGGTCGHPLRMSFSVRRRICPPRKPMSNT